MSRRIVLTAAGDDSHCGMRRIYLSASALLGLFSVMLGAFATHALKGTIPDADLAIFETAARYQMYHAIAMLALGLAMDRVGKSGRAVLGLWLFGTIVFSGSLYAIVLTGVRAFGAVAPIGGLSLMAGWAFLFVSAVRHEGFPPR